MLFYDQQLKSISFYPKIIKNYRKLFKNYLTPTDSTDITRMGLNN